MPAVQYPFIDIAVHERVKDHFARGEAIVLFSLDLSDVYWANGQGAALFGKPVIYDLIEDGPNRNDVTFRQVDATGRQLVAVGESRTFVIRIAHGFQRIPVQALVERIHLTADVDALLFASPVSNRPLDHKTVARDMLQGFDDDDTHMAVLGGDGEIIASSAGFGRLDLKPATARTLVAMAGNDPHRLVKRPVPTAKGYLPAAIGKVSDQPALHLLFAVETILGNMGPATPFPEEAEANARAAAPAAGSPVLPVDVAAGSPDTEPASADEPIIDSATEEPVAVEPVFESPETESIATEEISEAGDDSEPSLVSAPSIETPDVENETSDAEEPQDVRDDVAPGDAPAAPLPDAVSAAIADADGQSPEQGSEDVPAPAGPDPEAVIDPKPLDEEAPAESQAAVSDAAVETASLVPAADTEAPAAPVQETAPAVPEDGFRFNRAARPTRFVWKIDAEGQFSEISAELGAAVGPHAALLAGSSFTDIASLLDLDPEGKIAELLGRRDTWSGKTIYWPIEGTSLRAPVDLAALPTYKRNREFDGFRGFGIVRLSDAVEDPLAIGLTLGEGDVLPVSGTDPSEPALPGDVVPAAAEPEPAGVPTVTAAEDVEAEPVGTPAEGIAAPEADIDMSAEAADAPAPDGHAPTAEETPAERPEPETPRSEPPVLRISEPAPRAEDKIIRLEERRLRGREGLSPVEQEAFREIARQLESLKRDETDADETASEADDGEGISDPAETARTGTHAEWSGDAGPADAIDAERPAATEAEAPQDPVTAETDSDAADERMAEETPVAVAPQGPASSATETEQLEILAASIPARTAMDGGLSPEALDAIPVALLIHAGERLIHANPEFLKLSGYRRLEELEAVGGLDSLLHHKDLEEMPEQSGGLSLVRADDQLVPVTARLQSIRWAEQTALLLALIPSGPRLAAVEPPVPALSDAEEERLNDRIHALEGEVDELKSILETATDGVVIIGPEGDIRSMNRSASALFDYDEAETRGKPFVMLFAHESHRAVADYLAGMTGHGVASVLNDGREVIGREASGGFIPLFMTIGRLSASSGFCAVIRDITQWKRSEEDLKSAKRAAETANAHKSDFLARVSHEIRTPLNAIIGFSDMMAIEHFGPIGHPRYVEYANDIARSGRLVLDIVNDLLDISKIEAGEMDLDFTAVGLNEAVSEAVSLVQPQAHTQRVIIRTAFSDAVPDVVADLRSIKQIVLNILANAIRFTPAGGQIVVSTAYETNGSVVLRIRDTGVGMTRSELEQAMKPFRQVTAGARKRGDGTGLGLPLTKAMVDANRASFAIQSAPNEGTLVEITFPSPRVLAN